MIATRFKYNYTLKDALVAAGSILKKNDTSSAVLNELFSSSNIYYTSYARLGIKYVLKSFNLKAGAKVGVQPYTCSSVLSAITSAGYHPFFIDINDQLLLDTNDLAKKINEIDALIVTHIFGFPADIEKIKQITGNMPVMEDCAHALFSQYHGKQLGTFFDASVFSSGSGKFPSLGGGGLIAVNNKRYNDYIHHALEQLQSPGILKEIKNIAGSYVSALMHSKTGYALTNMLFSKQYFESRNKQILEYPEHEFKAYNSVKHILKDKLPGYIERSKMQNANGEYLSEKLGKHFHILRSKGNFVNYFAFPVLIGNRDEAYEFMKGKGIMCGKHFQHALPWALHHGYQKDTCPTFEKYEGQILTIPSNYSLKKKELDLIVRYLNEVAQKTT